MTVLCMPFRPAKRYMFLWESVYSFGVAICTYSGGESDQIRDLKLISFDMRD